MNSFFFWLFLVRFTFLCFLAGDFDLVFLFIGDLDLLFLLAGDLDLLFLFAGDLDLVFLLAGDFDLVFLFAGDLDLDRFLCSGFSISTSSFFLINRMLNLSFLLFLVAKYLQRSSLDIFRISVFVFGDFIRSTLSKSFFFNSSVVKGNWGFFLFPHLLFDDILESFCYPKIDPITVSIFFGDGRSSPSLPQEKRD